jgi:ribosomal protein L37AE/L43A
MKKQKAKRVYVCKYCALKNSLRLRLTLYVCASLQKKFNLPAVIYERAR